MLLRFLADESCDFNVVRTMRAAGYDVAAVTEFARRSSDNDIIRLAVAEGRILITEDRDFGRLVHAHARRTGGVVYLRYPSASRKTLPQAVLEVVEKQGEHLLSAFVVVMPGRIRITRMPAEP